MQQVTPEEREMLLTKLSSEALGKILTLMNPHLAQGILLVCVQCITQTQTSALPYWPRLSGDWSLGDV